MTTENLTREAWGRRFIDRWWNLSQGNDGETELWDWIYELYAEHGRERPEDVAEKQWKLAVDE